MDDVAERAGTSTNSRSVPGATWSTCFSSRRRSFEIQKVTGIPLKSASTRHASRPAADSSPTTFAVRDFTPCLGIYDGTSTV
jgi:hypothetical protein